MTLHMVGGKHTPYERTSYHSQTRGVNILSRFAAIMETQTNTHTDTLTKIPQYLIQLCNARGEAEVVIMSVFNSSLTGGCCFSVSKEHVNKQAELFKTETSSLLHPLSSSHAGIISGIERTGSRKKKFAIEVQTIQTPH